ncbi:MAG TPA: hypothetical protein PL182_05335 [Pseudobdellovibrionaceae bacterium]|nr:hypothetical protein [Pseudobdellovibrionaceae bacterium]
MGFFSRLRLVSISGLCFFGAFAHSAPTEKCGPSASPRILGTAALGQTSLWSFTSDLLSLGSFTLKTSKEQAHARWVLGNTNWSARENILNGIRIRQDAIRNLPTTDPFRRSLERDIRNLSKVRRADVGRIRHIRCLEGIAFREFLKVADLRSHPQEFQAVFMEKQGRIVMIGDFYRKSRRDVVGTSASKTADRERARLLREGWTYYAHLHNHPFDFKNAYGDVGGTLVPSDADIALYLSERPRYAWITNGLETIEISGKDFSRFEIKD